MLTSTANSERDTPVLIELRNARGDSAVIMSLGGIIHEWNIATEQHGILNIVLGYPHTHSYLKDPAFHGAIAGRYCNRIAGSSFTLDGQTYTLASNEGTNQLHGGPDGFSRRTWNVVEQSDQRLHLSLFSPDGDQGYPGNLDISLIYILDDDGALSLDWQASADTNTVVSLTSHAYFNLAVSDDILDHWLRIPADEYTPVNSEMIPTGEIRSVSGSALDLREFTRLRDVLHSEAPELRDCDGLDHNWAFGPCTELQLRAELLCPATNLLLTTSSTLPGLQCYSGNHLLANGVHGRHEGICLEPQHFPDSPNNPHFPSPVLHAGEVMRHSIRYRVSQVDAAALLTQS